MASSTEDADAVIEKKTYYDLEYFAYKIITSRGEDRIKFWNHYAVIHQLYQEKDAAYGRVHNIQLLLRLLVTFTAASIPNDVEVCGDIQVKSLSDWEDEEYDHIHDLLRNFANCLHRKDVNANVLEESEDEGIIKERKKDKLDPKFDQRLLNLLLILKVLRTVSPVRDSVISVWNESDEGTFDKAGVLEIDETIMKKFCETADAETNDFVKEALLGILQKPDENGNRKLVKNGKLRQKFENENWFKVGFLKKAVEKAGRFWLHRFFGPFVNQDNIALEDLEDLESDMDIDDQSLSRGREAFDEDEDEDEEDSYENSYAAASATRPKRRRSRTPSRSRNSNSSKKRAARGRLYHNKKSARRIDFSNSDEDDDDNVSDPEERHRDRHRRERRISTGSGQKILRKSPIKKSQQKQYAGRRMWTDAEKRAIREGMKVCGVDQWAVIKEEYSTELGTRTSGQIRDCFRTMLRRGELDDVIDDAREITANRNRTNNDNNDNGDDDDVES